MSLRTAVGFHAPRHAERSGSFDVIKLVVWLAAAILPWMAVWGVFSGFHSLH